MITKPKPADNRRGPAPNLVMLSNNIKFHPMLPVEGDEVRISALVLNNGSAPAEDVLVQFIDITSGTAVPIGREMFIDFIAIGESGSVEVTYKTDNWDSSRKIQVLVDSNNLIAETNEGDNEAMKTLAVTAGSAANLVMLPENIGFNPSEANDGEMVLIHATVLNRGTTDASNIVVQFVNVTTGRPLPIGQPQLIESIPMGASGTTQVTLDTSGQAGEHRIRVLVDPTNFIVETDETDNRATQTLMVNESARSNLLVQSANIGFNPTRPVEGEPVSMTVTIQNDGSVDADGVLVQFADVTDGTLQPVDKKQIIDLIPAGGTATVQGTYETMDKVGERKIQVLVDPHSTIPELNERDNTAIQTLMVAAPPAPNLVVHDKNIGFSSITPITGDDVTIHASIRNNGDADAQNVSVQFVDVTDGGAVPIGTNQIIVEIPVGGSSTVEIGYSTVGLFGDRKIQVIADRNNLLVESSEKDNVAKATLTVGLPTIPNLVMLSSNIGFDPVTPNPGDQVTIFATILNNGTADASDIAVQFVDTTNSSSLPMGQPQTIETIPAGGSATVQITYDTAQFASTNSIKVDDRKIKVVVDPNNFIREAKESDNEAQKTLELIQPAAPDLVASASNIGFSPSEPQVGDEVTVHAVVRNEGNLEATDVVVQFLIENEDERCRLVHLKRSISFPLVGPALLR
ncbi:hypothetical protein KFU94_67995 [Chloroflexi bacterium TSY]|nr:hypothetical protein [Chloroflexi bacterium TSY]